MFKQAKMRPKPYENPLLQILTITEDVVTVSKDPTVGDGYGGNNGGFDWGVN